MAVASNRPLLVCERHSPTPASQPTACKCQSSALEFVKIFCAKNHNHALTLIEVLVVMVVATAITAVAFFNVRYKTCTATSQTYCLNNQRQIGLAFRVWAGDNNDKFP